MSGHEHDLHSLPVPGQAATVGALVWGLIAMARGGEFNSRWSTKMMRYRVLFQAIALIFFALAPVPVRLVGFLRGL